MRPGTPMSKHGLDVCQHGKKRLYSYQTPERDCPEITIDVTKVKDPNGRLCEFHQYVSTIPSYER